MRTIVQSCLVALGELNAERRHRPENAYSAEVTFLARDASGCAGLFKLEWVTGNVMHVWQVEMFTGNKQMLGQIDLSSFDNDNVSVAIVVAGFVKACLRSEEG